MRKVLTTLLCASAVLLFSGCSWFDSAPVGPQILGVTHIVQERGLTYVEIDSMRYPVTEVFTGETHPRVGGDVAVEPVAGMQVTVVEMTGSNNNYQGIMFMLGEWNEAQIEAAFHRNYTFMVLALGGIFFCVLGMIIACFVEDERQKRKNSVAS